MKSKRSYINRSLAISCVVPAVLAASLAFAGSAAPNFSGTWVLDKSRSKDLPRQLENVESYTLNVTQDTQELTVDPKIVRGARQSERPADSGDTAGGGGQGGRRGYGGGGGMRGGRMGGGMGLGKSTFRLDGKESTAESATTGDATQATFKAKLNSSTLELTTTRNLNFQGNSFTMTTKERWELADGGKTLKVQRTTETPRGVQESNLVFSKQ